MSLKKLINYTTKDIDIDFEIGCNLKSINFLIKNNKKIDECFVIACKLEQIDTINYLVNFKNAYLNTFVIYKYGSSKFVSELYKLYKSKFDIFNINNGLEGACLSGNSDIVDASY